MTESEYQTCVSNINIAIANATKWNVLINKYKNFESILTNAKKEIENSITNMDYNRTNNLSGYLRINHKIYRSDDIDTISKELNKRKQELKELYDKAVEQHENAISNKNSAISTFNYYNNKIVSPYKKIRLPIGL